MTSTQRREVGDASTDLPGTSAHPVGCQCGNLKGTLTELRRTLRAVCYCHDCQAFAYVLGQEGRVLDQRGGSEIVQAAPRNLTFTQGAEALACVRLTSRGLLRWYAACCSTPIGNTPATAKLSFVGLVHTCLGPRDAAFQEAFGPVRAWVYTAGARGEPRPKEAGGGRMVRRFIGIALRARLNGDYRRTPFFDPATGAPVATPRVLSREEHARVMESVRRA
jgi:hypothetical protein